MDYILFDKVNYKTTINDIRETVSSFEGDILNAGLFQNYCDTTQYYDDCFEKTAMFLDSISLEDTQDTYVRKSKNFSMREY
jgi:hypothetical protein